MLNNMQIDKVTKDVFHLIDPENLNKSEHYREKSLFDIRISLLYTLQGIQLRNKKIIINYYQWLADVFTQYGIDGKMSETVFKNIVKVLSNILQKDDVDFLENISLTTKKKTDTKDHNEYVDHYVSLILKQKRFDAIKYIRELSEKLPIEELLVGVLQESLYQIGRLWQSNTITVAQEHYASAVTQYILSNIAATINKDTNESKKLLATTIGSELHQIGLQMVSEMYEINGWDVAFLGGNLPKNELLSYIDIYQPNIIAFSITLAIHLGQLQSIISEIKEINNNVKIIVGGKPFIEDGELYKKIGADGFAKSAIEAVNIGEKLLNAS